MLANMKLRPLSSIAIFVVLCCAEGFSQQAATPAPGTSTGQAIGNGVKSFIDTIFPGGSALLTLLQGWLSKKLNPQQSQQVQKAADQQKQQVIDPKVKSALADIQRGANTMKVTSVALYRSQVASNRLSAMIAIIDQASPGTSLPFANLGSRWNDAKAALSSLKNDKTISDARSAITDVAVLDSLQGLDDATGGPVATIDANLKPDGDRPTLRQALQQILAATTAFDNIGVVLLGSTGSEITTVISNITAAGGGSSLDQVTTETLIQAKAALPKPTNK
jgi:hypothetical protein